MRALSDYRDGLTPRVLQNYYPMEIYPNSDLTALTVDWQEFAQIVDISISLCRSSKNIKKVSLNQQARKFFQSNVFNVEGPRSLLLLGNKVLSMPYASLTGKMILSN